MAFYYPINSYDKVFLTARGIKGESFPLQNAANTLAWTAQSTFGMLIPFRGGDIITGVGFVVSAAPGTPANLTKGKVGVWDTAGVLLASSADAPTSFQSVGRIKLALSAAYTVPAEGGLVVGCWMDGTSMPSLARNSAVSQAGGAFTGGSATCFTRAGDADIPNGSAFTVSNTGVYFAWY